MSNQYTISISCDPPTQTHQARLRAFKIGQHCRIVKVKPDAKTVAFQAALKREVEKLRLSLGTSFVCQGAVHLHIYFEFPYLKSHKETGSQIPKVTRPDLDNMAKTILDALTDAKAFEDDSQVTHLEMVKAYGPQPSVVVTLTPLPL